MYGISGEGDKAVFKEQIFFTFFSNIYKSARQAAGYPGQWQTFAEN